MKNDDIRCGQCARLLAKGTAIVLAIKCPRCKTLNTITMRPSEGQQDSQEQQ